MVKISQYQRQNVVSSAVGVPQMDTSAEIMATGIVRGVASVTSLLGERQKKADDLASDVKMSEFVIQYGQGKGKAMQEFRDKPFELPGHARNEGGKLAEAMAADMEPGVAQQFKEKTSNFLLQDTQNSVQWAHQRDQQIIFGNIEKGYNNLEIASQAAATPEALGGILNEMENHSIKSQAFIGYSSDYQLKERAVKAAKENALSGRVSTDPQVALQEIMSEKWNTVKIKDKDGAEKEVKLLTPTERSHYATMMKNAAIYSATVNQYRSLTTAGAQISEMTDRLGAGELPISEINLQLEWAKLHENDVDINGNRIIPEQYINGLETLKSLRLKQDYRTAEQKRADATEYQREWEAKWDKYLFDKPDRQAGVKDYNDVISMYSHALRANQNGIIDDARFATIKKIMDTKLKAGLKSKNMSAGITDALNNAATKGLSFWDAYNREENLYSKGYTQIGAYFKKRQDLSIVEKQKQTEDLLVKYTELLDAMPQEEKDKVQNIDQAVSDILKGRFEKGKQVSVGLFDRLTVIKDKEGNIYQKYQIVQRNGGSYAIKGIKEETGEIEYLPVKAK